MIKNHLEDVKLCRLGHKKGKHKSKKSESRNAFINNEVRFTTKKRAGRMTSPNIFTL